MQISMLSPFWVTDRGLSVDRLEQPAYPRNVIHRVRMPKRPATECGSGAT